MFAFGLVVEFKSVDVFLGKRKLKLLGKAFGVLVAFLRVQACKVCLIWFGVAE